MANKDVFISYKTEEFDDAIWVKSVLESNGISCWMAPMCIPGGSSYAVEIPNAIRNCKVFVLILSEKSQQSKWVPKEIDQAINAGKTILPFMLENCELKDDFNFYLTNVQRYAAYESKTAAIERMLREIRALLGIDTESNSLSENQVLEGTVSEDTKDITNDTPAAVADNTVESELKPESVPAPAPKSTPKEKAKKKDKEKIEKPKKIIKEKKEKKLSDTDKTKALKKLFIIGGAAAAAVLVAVLVVVLVMGSRITVAGQSFQKNDTVLELENVELTGSDINNIKKFKSLTTLRLVNCKLPDADLGFLSEKVTDILVIENCSLKDEHLEKFDFSESTLTSLDVDHNPDLTQLKKIEELADTLTNLSVNDTGITDLKFVSALTGLTELDAGGLGIGDDMLKDISDCKELTSLSLNGNKLKSLSKLSKLEKLVELNVGNNKLEDLDGLEKCIRLEYIDAHKNSIYEISGLENTTLLKTVILKDNKLSDIRALKNSASSIVKLDVSNNNVYDFYCLEGSKSLTELRIDGNPCYGIEDFCDCTSLKIISASDCSMLDMEGFEDLTALTYIDVSDNYIDSAEAFCGTDDGAGITVDLSNNGMYEFDMAIDANAYYNCIALYGNSIEDLSALEAAKGSILAFDYNEGIDFEGLASSGFSEYYVLECPLDRQVEIEGYFGSSVSFVTEKEIAEIIEEGNQEE